LTQRDASKARHFFHPHDPKYRIDKLTQKTYLVSMAGMTLETLTEELQRWADIEAADPSDSRLRTRRRILNAATELFSTHGYRKTNIDEVARDAGIAKGSVYLYFKSKAELLIHAVAEAKMAYFAEILPLLEAPDLDPTARIEAYLAAAFRLVAEVPLLARLMSGDREILMALDDLGEAFNEQIHDAQLRFLTTLLSSVPGADPETVAEDAQVLIGIIYGMPPILAHGQRRNIDPATFARMLARLIVEGVNR